MKRGFLVIALMFISICIFGCGRKQAVEEQMEPVSMEELSTLNTTGGVPTSLEAAKVPVTKPQMIEIKPAVSIKLAPLPPAGPYKPSGLEIQTALKNANFYTGEIDGKIGPTTKKAIQAFQQANNLQADGKVGPKTWAVLSGYLNPPAAAPVKKKR